MRRGSSLLDAAGQTNSISLSSFISVLWFLFVAFKVSRNRFDLIVPGTLRNRHGLGSMFNCFYMEEALSELEGVSP